jgi:hypothetical protein
MQAMLMMYVRQKNSACANFVATAQRQKRRDSQRNSNQNCARTEDVLAIILRGDFFFGAKFGVILLKIRLS